MRTLSAALTTILFLGITPVGAANVATTSDAPPEILERIDLPEDLAALTVSTDGSRAAWAVPLGGPKGQSAIFRSGGPSTTESTTVRGQIKDLLFLEDGRLLGLLFRPAKKWEGDTYLISWAPEAPKSERVMRVPPSSSDLDHWPARQGIVIACRNEIRTLLEPDMRSGPVFMVPGSNLAITTMGSSSLVWVGQEDGIVLVDLSAPSGREPMTALARQPAPAAVVGLADYPDGSTTLVRLTDGRLFRASLDPPGFEAHGSADHIVRLAKSAGGPPIASAPRRPAPEPPETAVAERHVEPDTEAPEPTDPEPVPVVEHTRDKPTIEPKTETVAVKAPDTPKPEPATQPVAVRTPDKPKVEATPEPSTLRYQLHGKLTGAVGLVREVVLLGPDNILEEAARLQPDEEGRWGIERLAPGRYRVQVDGGGGRVLVADPRLVLVEVGTEPTEAPEIRIVRAF